MKQVADAVLQLIQHDEIALESFRENILNLSAYAEKIHKSVEKLTYKDVKRGTIIVALSRLNKSSLKLSEKPNIKISHIGTRSPVTSFTYKKTSDTERRVSTLSPYLISPADLFGILEGEGEIIIISSEKAAELIKDHIGVIPKKEVSDLVAITLQLPENIENNTPRILSSLLALMAVQKVNVVNVLPALNEIAFIIDKNNSEQAIAALNLYS
jgi:hypothetical protein